MRFRQTRGAGSMSTARTSPESLGAVILVGNPNVGKSVVFGALTGRYVNVSNYPGTTVEVTRGEAHDRGTSARGDRHPRGVLPPSHVRGRAGHAGHPDAGARRAGPAGVRRQEHATLPDDHRATRRDGGSARARRQHGGRSAGAGGDAPAGDPPGAHRGPGGFHRGGAGKRGRTASSPSSNDRPRPRYGSTTEAGSKRPSSGWKGCSRSERRSGRERLRSCCCAATTPSLRGCRRTSPPPGSGR